MSPSISTSKKNSMMDKKIQKYKQAKQTILKYQEFIKKILITLVKILLMR